MTILTVSLFVLGWGWKGAPGRINRVAGSALIASFAGYTIFLLVSVFGPGAA